MPGIIIVGIFILLIVLRKIKRNQKNGVSIKTLYAEPEIISYKERIKTAYKDKNGLYPHEILLLSYAPKFYVNQKKFQRFWYYRYGIKDCNKILKSLVQSDFLETKYDLKANLEKQTVSYLKELLQKNGLTVTGKKEELIKRACEIDENNIPNELKKESYFLTDKGIDSLKNSEYVRYIHDHAIEGLDIWSLNILVNTGKKLGYRDVIWGYLNKKSISHASHGDFGLYRNCKLTMHDFVCEEGKYSIAYTILMEVIYLDINDYLGNNFNKEYLNISLQYYFDSQNIERISKTIISYMEDIQSKLNISDEQLRLDLITNWSKYHFPVQLFEVSQCADIYFWEKTENQKELKRFYSMTKKKYLK